MGCLIYLARVEHSSLQSDGVGATAVNGWYVDATAPDRGVDMHTCQLRLVLGVPVYLVYEYLFI